MLRKILVTILCFTFIVLSACTTARAPQPANHSAKYNVELGLGYLQRGEMARAKHKLLLAEQEAPHDPLVLDALGYFYERTGEPKRAETYFQDAIKLAPKRGAIQNNYGTFLCRQGHYQASLNHFAKAAADPHYLHPDLAYTNAGQCALKIPNRELAKYYFKRALAHNPKQATALLELKKLGYNPQ